MPRGRGIMMALRIARLAGVLMFSNVQASDIADGSTIHGFLSKYMPLRSESSKSFIGDKGKFMAHHLNRMEHGGRPEALSDQYGLVEGASVPVDNFKPQKIADDKEDTDVQKLLSNESNKLIGFSASAVAVALLSLAMMVGVRMRRGMQPAIALAGSSGHGNDMSIPLTTLSADNTLDFKSADINSSFVHWDPLGLGEGAPNAHVRNFRERELQHGQAATIAVFFVSAAAVRSADLTVVAGRNDKRTKKGKIYAHSNGKSRPRKSNKKGEAPDPYSTLREWGKRQDPPMSVEEVVAQRVSELRKVEVTNADILDAITPF